MTIFARFFFFTNFTRLLYFLEILHIYVDFSSLALFFVVVLFFYLCILKRTLSSLYLLPFYSKQNERKKVKNM